jgi:hypothetical protein
VRRVSAVTPPLIALAIVLDVFALGLLARRRIERGMRWDVDFERKLRRWDGLVPVWLEDDSRRRR